MVTKIDTEKQKKVRAKFSQAEIDQLKAERCRICKRSRGLECSCGLLPVTSDGDFCPHYLD